MLENKNIGQSHLEDLCIINKNHLPSIDDYIIVEIYDRSEKVVTSFKHKDWKKNVKKLLKMSNEEFDTTGIIKENYITYLTQKDYFVDGDFSKDDAVIEVYDKEKLFRKFTLNEWTKHLDLINAGSSKIKELDYNKYISTLMEKMYFQKKMIVLDKETLIEKKKNDVKVYGEKVQSLTKKFLENFSKEYDVDFQTSENLLNICRKYIFDNGYPHYEELMIDILNYKNS